MLKTDICQLEQSNIANLSGEDHRAATLAASKSETAWHGAGEKEGIECWRIESFGVKRTDPSTHGTFYSGDSYIVLQTYKKDPKSASLQYNVFFWLGDSSSQDERGVAAYKTVELDDFLGDMPVQYRETQGFESSNFLALFDNTIRVLDGGIASAFNHVKPDEYQPRLLQMKGKRSVRVTQVPLNLSSLNSGDVFVLDAGLALYQWNGKEASIFEKRKAGDVLNRLQEERLGKPRKVLLDHLEDHEEFWSFFGGKPSSISAPIPDSESAKEFVSVLYRVSDASGSLRADEVSSGKGNVRRSQLDSNDVFLFDLGDQMYVWVGKNSTKQERAGALNSATTFLAQQSRPLSTPVVRLVEDGETQSFLDALSA